jgi:hypothetical protein
MLNKDELNSQSSMSRTFDPPPKNDNRGCQTYYRDTCSSFDPSVASAAYLNLAQLAYSDSPASCIQHAKLNGTTTWSNLESKTIKIKRLEHVFTLGVTGVIIGETNELVIAYRGTDENLALMHEMLAERSTDLVQYKYSRPVSINSFFNHCFNQTLLWVEQYITTHYTSNMNLVFVGLTR